MHSLEKVQTKKSLTNFKISNSQPHHLTQNSKVSIQDPDLFGFLKTDEEEKRQKPHHSSRKKGLSQDLIQVTDAEPDVSLEVFYALYNVLQLQLERLNERKKLGMEGHRLITFFKMRGKNLFLGVRLKF